MHPLKDSSTTVKGGDRDLIRTTGREDGVDEVCSADLVLTVKETPEPQPGLKEGSN